MLLELHVEGEAQSLRPNGEHPFFVQRSGGDKADWLRADRIQVGDRILTVSGEWGAVTGISPTPTEATVYNFQVEDNHDFFVGEAGYLVHNPPACGFGNVQGGETTAENALTQAENYLGDEYQEIDNGVFRSEKNLRQFRMTEDDLTDPVQGSHVHFEAIDADGRTIIENAHVRIINP